MDPVLSIPTFYPSWEEFKDFKNYIKLIESKGAHRAGLARVSISYKAFLSEKLQATVKSCVMVVIRYIFNAKI